MILLDGRATSQTLLSEIKSQVAKLPITPRLDIILVGNDPASLKYVALKQKKAAEVGIKGEIVQLPAAATSADVLRRVHELNTNPDVTAFMIQLPLPKSITPTPVLTAIAPEKDADGLHPLNLGRLFVSDPTALAAATPLGIIKLLEAYHLQFEGQQVVIIGRSPIIGLPLFALCNQRNATVTLCHSHTKNLTEICSQADILVTAVGRPNFVTADMVKEGAVVVDIGTNYDTAGHLCGDVDFTSVSSKASYITPVPGGVGPMTVATLLYNTFKIAQSNYDPRDARPSTSSH
ncbi:bifunctional 5,10-methylenetetrahydrofolate dehydrogenase/5,10-methenyltetrahydrofolate cyclohydrolase [Patescibacteria group bacterium]|nr:bifunctional 5,10-methylenetetrahydrofolate dehydrogenase/5,10-methenyltetrahydrofolate cyclohydrolase [Patescibacteria group bacterium]